MCNFQFYFFYFFYFFSVATFLIYLGIKSKKGINYYSKNFFFNFFFINLFFFLLATAGYRDYFDMGITFFLIDFTLIKNFLWWATPGIYLFLIFLKFSKTSRVGVNIYFWVAFTLFFFFIGTAVGLPLIIDTLVSLEFSNMALLLFLVVILGVSPSSAGGFRFNRGANINYNSPNYLSFSILNFLFSMFFLSLILFLFFLFFFFHNFGVNSSYSLFFLMKYHRIESFFFSLFFFFLVLKLGGAPFFIWKLEVFSSLSLTNLFFYSVVYLFFLFYFFYTIFLKFNIFFFSSAEPLLYILVVFNLGFIILSTNAVLDLRQFIILSTLINSLFFFLAIFLCQEFRLNFFFIFFLNYVLTSFSFFYFIVTFQGEPKSISEVRSTRNHLVNCVYFGGPLLSLAGAAPTIGFIFKFLFLTGAVSYNYFFFFLLSFLIVYTSLFYFQFFKNFFFFKKKNFKNQLGEGRKALTNESPQPTLLIVFFFLFSTCAFFYLNSLFFWFSCSSNFFFF